MNSFYLSKLCFCLIFHNLFLSNCEEITIWDNQDIGQSRSSLTIRMMHNSQVDKGLLKSIFDALKQQKFLPKCAMVGCASNSTQCVAHGGIEMLNKMSIDDYTQAYFKSIFTMDKTFLSINCKNVLVPCCFRRTVIDDKPKPPFLQSFASLSSFQFPSLPQLAALPSLPSRPQFVRVLNSLIPDMPPMSIYVMSNICMGIGGSCKKEEEE